MSILILVKREDECRSKISRQAELHFLEDASTTSAQVREFFLEKTSLRFPGPVADVTLS